MKVIRALATAIALAAIVPALPAQAQKLDMSKTTCKDMLESGKDGLIIIWSWLYGYYSADDAEPILDFGVLTQKGQKLAEACKANPSTDIISAAKPIYE
jgi:hypothetical protein